ncbi:MAG: DUF4340 domain-containing protein [Desulfobacterales bacterium]|nr:DUF4340 domain-containing protein [Desulfobacterales bacterium]
MNPKKITFLSALLLLLAVFYYVYEVRWTARQKEKVGASKKVLNIDGENVERIRLKNPKGTVVVEKKGKDWFISEPIKTEADRWASEQIVDTLSDGKWEREIKPLPENLADFGLAGPEIEAALSVAGISAPEKVLVGGENPAGNMRYVRVNQEERLLLVYARFRDALNKNADDLRDKRIIRFKEDAVAKMIWRVDNKKFAAEKKEKKWTLLRPAAEKIAESRIKSLVWRLEGLKSKKIFEKPERPLSYYGLDKPRAMVKLMDENGMLVCGLSFGVRKEPAVSYYAKSDGSDTIYELSHDFVNNLPKPEEEKEDNESEESIQKGKLRP